MLLSERREAAQVFLRLPGTPDQVRRVRQWISAELGPGHPLRDDCLLLASEVVTNAIVHSATGAGGTFSVSLTYSRTQAVVTVQDDGSAFPPCACHTTSNSPATSGRGIPLIENLSHRWGLTRQSGTNEVWFELIAP
jgi:anti-sigma regulatory factor (Ser/Thr protein kinase)